MHLDEISQRVSHETILCQHLCPSSRRAEKRAGGSTSAEQADAGSTPYHGRHADGVPEQLRIVHRPDEVRQRMVPGHWAGDLSKGAFNRSCVGTLVERKTRFVILCKIDGGTAEAALVSFSRQLKKLPESMRTSLTYNRGTELTCYPELTGRMGIDVWFADPRPPWQRGSNENTNGLLRQFLPKGIHLSSASQEYLDHVAMLMNTRPHQTLGWETPAEVSDKEIAEFR